MRMKSARYSRRLNAANSVEIGWRNGTTVCRSCTACAEQRASHDIWLKELTAQSAEPVTANDITTTLHLKQGAPEEVVLDVCEKVNADLLIVGTVGITDVPGVLIGNTAETILSNAPCSMLTLKPRGFQSPVDI